MILEHIHPGLLARIILLAIREGRVTDWKTLHAEFLLYDMKDRYSTACTQVDKAVKDLVEARLIYVENYFTREGKISLTPSWPRIQTTLGISLKELVEIDPGLSMSVKPFFGKPKKLATSNLDVFMAMPFSEALNPIFEDHIKKVVESANLIIVRGDDFFTANSVMEDVWLAICAARIVIAECTGRNPNVFYEIGMAHTIGKPIILITQNGNDVPFDLRHIRYIRYDYNPRGMKSFEVSLKRTLAETLKGEGSE